jgi:hypothetical protein
MVNPILCIFPAVMPIFTGGIVGAIAELTTDRRSGSYLASIGGAFFGTAIGGFIYGHLKRAGVDDIFKLPLFAAPVLTLSCLFFNSTLESYFSAFSTGSFNISPWMDYNQLGFSMRVKY